MYSLIGFELDFTWDEPKHRRNKRKHGVTFEEAASVFLDPSAMSNFDLDHSEPEDRFVLLGMSSSPRLLLVCHCYRQESRVIRIISARKADAKETQEYQRHHAGPL